MSIIKEIANATVKYRHDKKQCQAAIDRIWLKYGRIAMEQEEKKKAYMDSGSLVNISKSPMSLEWFIDDRVAGNNISAAEQMISEILDQYHLSYVQEASMYGLQLPSGGYARYDFLLKIGSPYVLVEYDSVAHHSTEYQLQRDALKNRWCTERGIRLLRWNKSHYYRMEDVIAELMTEYGVRKKR